MAETKTIQYGMKEIEVDENGLPDCASDPDSDALLWDYYATAALSAVMRTTTAAKMVADLAAQIADQLCLEHAKRFE